MKLTVIIPVFNQEELVIKALNSIPARDDIEIIVIDDKSTDKTYANVLSYIFHNEEKNITLLQNEENKGVGYTVNKGYDNATGEYVVLLGSDDYFTSNFESAINELDGTDMIYFNLIDNTGTIWEITPKNKNSYVGSVKFMRREFIGDTRCPEKRALEDVSFHEQLMAKKPTEKYLNKIIKHYNFPRENSLTDLVLKGKIK